MAWANKYRFRFDSVHGVEFNIYIQKDGYEGDVIQRALGRAPVLSKKKNGPICGTSLEIFAQCEVDGEFAEFYTTDPKAFRVLLYRGQSLIWSGFVSTELYSEPSIAPPYDVQIVATDGLGELKLNTYPRRGRIKLRALLQGLLSYTGEDRDIYIAWNVAEYQGTEADFLEDTLINLDFMEGKSIYDVLTYILKSFNATITQHSNIWLITRETDIPNGSTPYAYRIPVGNGSVTYEPIPEVTSTVGQMGVANIWPIGNYATKIEPARKSVVLTSPFNYLQILENPEIQQHGGGWTVLGNYSWGLGVLVLGSVTITPSSTSILGGSIYQGVQMRGLVSSIDITVRIQGTSKDSRYLIYANYYIPSTGVSYYGTPEGWTLGDYPPSDYGDSEPISDGQEFTISIPNANLNTPGTLGIHVVGYGIAVADVRAYFKKGFKGYKDTLYIDNDARGEGEEEEILHGRITDTEFTFPGELAGAFMKMDNNVLEYIYLFQDSVHSNADFLALEALSNALSVALPRLRQEGTFNIPSSLTTIPMLLSFDNVGYIVETFDWDLRNEEAKIAVLSLPAASLTVEEEKVEWLDNSYSSPASSSGGGSSSGGSAPVSGISLRDVWRSLTNDSTLTTHDNTTPIAAAHLSSIFTIETRSSGGQTYYYLKLNTNYEGLTAAGYITAGAAAASSDARLKDDVKAIDPARASALLAALRGCEWTWNGLKEFLAGSHGSGLIAQEVAKVLPWAVIDLGGELSLNYNALWGIAVPVMQDQQRRIEDLERRVSQLEKALDNILKKDV